MRLPTLLFLFSLIQLPAWASEGDGQRADELLEEVETLSLSDPPQALPLAKQALELARGLEDPERIHEALRLVGIVHMRLGDYESALRVEREALSLCQEQGDLECEAGAHNNLGGTYIEAGDLHQAVHHLGQAVEIGRQIEHRALPDALKNLAIAYKRLEEQDRALELLLEADALASQDGYDRPAGLGNSLGVAYQQQDRCDLALPWYDRDLAEALESGDIVRAAGTRANRGNCLSKLGREDEALAEVRAGLQQYDEAGYTRGVLICNGILTQMLMEDQPDLALEHARTTVQLARELEQDELLSQALEVHHQSAHAVGEHEEAYLAAVEYHEKREALWGEKASRELGRVEAQVEHEQELRAIEIARIEEAGLQARKRQQLLYGLLATVVLSLVSIAFLVLVQRRNRQMAQQAEALRQAKQELERLVHVAESASRAKGAFLANMSHELRTPLSAVLGNAQLLERQGSLLPEAQQMVRTIRVSGDHLLSLINDVLDMAKIEAGRASLEAEDFDLHACLRAIRRMVAGKAADKGLRLRISDPQSLPRFVRSDERKLKQILLNLLSNALKFTKQGEVTVELGHLEDQLHIAVHDTGPGIPGEDQERLFEAFVQSETGRTAGGGTGLGLALSRELARLLGGDISLESEPGVGTTVRFHLHAPEVATLEPSAGTERRAMALAEGQAPPEVLVVDDSTVNRRLLCDLLQTVGCRVRDAADGQQALERVAELLPDLIWMDARMPVMDGIEATQRLRAEHPELVVLALSASVSEADGEAFLAAGAAAYLRKPYREAEIFEAMEQHAGTRFSWQELQDKDERDSPLGPNDLDVLNEEVRARLRSAATTGDTDTLETIVDGLRPEHPTLARKLTTCLRRYDYEAMLDALEDRASRARHAGMSKD